jgi:rubrerythrin
MFKNIKKKNKRTFRTYRSSNDQDDSNFYRCNVCGFFCNSDRVEVWKKVSVERDQYEDGNTVNETAGSVDSVTADRGCPLCGSLYSK